MFARIRDSYVAQQELRDARIQKGSQPTLPWTSIEFLVCANAFYLLFTLALYKIMQARKEPVKCKPFKTILLVYNLTCVMLAGYVVYGIGGALLSSSYRFVCNKTVDPGSQEDRDGQASLMAHFFWVFYAQKFWEFLDTWFFILRKSFRQVTFLHVFHHCSINIVVGLILPFEFNGDMYLPIFLNALVHVLMYSHYLVAALGMSTPWKPWLTSMQLGQFMLIATQSALSLSRGDTCGAPYFAKVGMVAYMGSMLLLFGNFFLNAYVLKKPSAKFGGGVVKRLDSVQVTKSLSGRAILDEKGAATVELPASFLEGDLHYQVTPIGKPMPNLHVSREPLADTCNFELAGGSANRSVSWTVTRVITLLGETKPKKRVFSCCGDDQHSTADNAQDPQQGLCCSSPHADKKGQ
mmetsp:Transcript_97575/g.281562  ORF Transcript_97575/g.281562 Transcript_97575/m.281562 type:complete len:408 (-) Transcript_97575:130-1353(-)